MNYKEFLEYKKQFKDTHVDLSNTNLYAYFNIPDEVVNENEPVYRCHLLEDYLKAFQLPDELKTNIGVSDGVRHSLKILFKELDNWIIPEDVYPFYQANIEKEYKTYKTLTKELFFKYSDMLFNDIPNGTLLIAFPLKPYGRVYVLDEFNNLRKFLKQDKNNLIVVDMVYWNYFEYPKEILELYKSGRVVILHSMSKMFMLPERFGVCILPDKLIHLKELFKVLPKNNKKLLEAKSRLQNTELINNIKIKHLMNNFKLMNKGLLNNTSYLSYMTSYLFYDYHKSHEKYLHDGYITIPESVFGGTGDGSIISSLITEE